jgi:hypothetical protein
MSARPVTAADNNIRFHLYGNGNTDSDLVAVTGNR